MTENNVFDPTRDRVVAITPEGQHVHVGMPELVRDMGEVADQLPRPAELPDDIRQGIAEIQKAIPDIFARLAALEERTDGGSLEHMHAALTKLTELVGGLAQSKSQLGAQGKDLDARLSKVESQCVTILRAFIEVNNMLAPESAKSAEAAA